MIQRQHGMELERGNITHSLAVLKLQAREDSIADDPSTGQVTPMQYSY